MGIGEGQLASARRRPIASIMIREERADTGAFVDLVAGR